MSNGSERINAGDVTGPRWVGGVNAPAPGGGDYKALLAQAARLSAYTAAHRLADAVETLLAERDALRAQLDGMTVDWGTEVVDVDGRTTDRDVWDTEEGARRVARQYGDTLVRRLVSPWTAVEDAEGGL